MTVGPMRPTYLMESAVPAENLMACLQRGFAQFPDEFQSQFRRRHAMVSILESRRHFWSPWLHLETQEREEGCELRIRFSPHPSIWTGFMFAYLALVVLSFFALMLGISQQLVHQTPWAYWVIPVCLAMAAILWIASQAGQRLANDQMRRMKEVIESCLADQSPHPVDDEASR